MLLLKNFQVFDADAVVLAIFMHIFCLLFKLLFQFEKEYNEKSIFCMKHNMAIYVLSLAYFSLLRQNQSSSEESKPKGSTFLTAIVFLHPLLSLAFLVLVDEPSLEALMSFVSFSSCKAT